MTIKVGILGFAHGHVNSYIGAWQAAPEMGIRIPCGWDHDAARLQKAVKEFGINGVESPEALMARPDVTAVVIAAETSLHAELVEKAAAAGKAIVLQKPMALTLSEADRIVAAVKASGVPFTMAWQMRVDPQNLKIRELLNEGALGRTFMVRRRHGLSVCLNEAFAGSWHMAPEWNRDIWADDAAHPIDFIYWLLGMPESVTAEIMTLHDPVMPMDNGVVILRYPNGPLAEVCCSFTNLAGENTTEIVGDKGSLIQNYGDVPSCHVPRPENACGLKWYLSEAGDWTYSDIPSPPSHGDRIAGLAGPMAEFLHGKRPAIATAAEGRDVLRLVLACYVSVREGRRTRPDDPAVKAV